MNSKPRFPITPVAPNGDMKPLEKTDIDAERKEAEAKKEDSAKQDELKIITKYFVRTVCLVEIAIFV